MSDTTFKVKAGKVWGATKIYFKTKKLVFNLRYGKFKMKTKKFLMSDDARATKKFMFEVSMDGLLLQALCYYFIGFAWINIAVLGCGWYFMKKQGFQQIRQILASLNLIKLGK